MLLRPAAQARSALDFVDVFRTRHGELRLAYVLTDAGLAEDIVGDAYARMTARGGLIVSTTRAPICVG